MSDATIPIAFSCGIALELCQPTEDTRRRARLDLNVSGCLRPPPDRRRTRMFTGISAGLRRKTTLAALAVAVLAATMIGASRASMAAAVQDPERNATTPTGWHFWVGQSKHKIDKYAKKAGERVVDVNVDSTSPLRFSAVLVRNTGPYARTGSWSY